MVIKVLFQPQVKVWHNNSYSSVELTQQLSLCTTYSEPYIIAFKTAPRSGNVQHFNLDWKQYFARMFSDKSCEPVVLPASVPLKLCVACSVIKTNTTTSSCAPRTEFENAVEYLASDLKKAVLREEIENTGKDAEFYTI